MISVIIDLKNAMAHKSFEFSLSSKLLHTRNPNSPIYDSKVRKYLSQQENVDFWWGQGTKKSYRSGVQKNITEQEKIRHDWENLCNWYTGILGSPRGKSWINWFDNNFPNHKNISDVKKIDFIIFATT